MPKWPLKLNAISAKGKMVSTNGVR
jgi:hypothetical protein